MEIKQLPEDIKELDRKIIEMRGKKDNNSGKGKNAWGGAIGMGVRIAADLLSGVIVGAGIGYVLDNVFGTRPFMFALFLLFGGAAGFLNVYRMAKDEENKGK